MDRNQKIPTINQVSISRNIDETKVEFVKGMNAKNKAPKFHTVKQRLYAARKRAGDATLSKDVSQEEENKENEEDLDLDEIRDMLNELRKAMRDMMEKDNILRQKINAKLRH